MRKFLEKVSLLTARFLLLVPTFLSIAILGGIFEHMGDTILGMFLLAMVMVGVSSIAHELWDRVRCEYLLREAMDGNGDTDDQLPQAVMMVPYVFSKDLIIFDLMIVLLGVIFYRVSSTRPTPMLAWTGIAATVLATCLAIMAVIYVYLWIQRKLHGEKTLRFMAFICWRAKDKIVMREMGPGQARDFYFREIDRTPLNVIRF